MHSLSLVDRPSSLALAGSQSRGRALDQRLQPKSEMQNHLVPKHCTTHFIFATVRQRRRKSVSPTLEVDTVVLAHEGGNALESSSAFPSYISGVDHFG